MSRSLDSETKAKKFLKDIMGEDSYNVLIKDGKIEINSGGYIYELHIDGKIINKSKNQKYCVVLASGIQGIDEIPLYDILAIKYSYLKYRIKLVERVANKTSLQRLYQEGERTTYADFIQHMEGSDWRRELLTINENSTNFVLVNDINAERGGTAVDITSPGGCSLSLMGIQQVPRGADLRSAYRFALNLSDDEGLEIPMWTQIQIIKMSATDVIHLSRIFYADITRTLNNLTDKSNDELYRFRHSFILRQYEKLLVNVVNPNVHISSRKTKLLMDLDLWRR